MNPKQYMDRIGIKDMQIVLSDKDMKAYAYAARFGDYTPMFELSVDDKLECVDYKTNLVLLDALADATAPMQDYLEPFCGSGFLSCFLAQDAEHYTGVDKNELGIAFARTRAAKAETNPDFVCSDFFEYSKEHEVIVSRFGITPAKENDIEDSVAKMTDLSDIIYIAQIPQPDNPDIEAYVKKEQQKFIKEFKKHDFKASIIHDKIRCYSNQLGIYVLEAKK